MHEGSNDLGLQLNNLQAVTTGSEVRLRADAAYPSRMFLSK